MAEWYQVFPEIENLELDLQGREACEQALRDAQIVYNLAADMGGMGFIENNRARCMLSVLINTHLLMAARKFHIQRYFYASSACVYAADKQVSPEVIALKEGDAYPAMPEDGYGWEKLFSERMCRHFREDFKGTQAILNSDILEPINLGSNELVTINGLVDLVEDIAGVKLKRTYNLKAPKGVNGRNSDNELIKKYLGWEPSVRLRNGMEKTYRWIYDQMVRANPRDPKRESVAK